MTEPPNPLDVICPKCGASRILYTRIEGCVVRHYLACTACGEEPPMTEPPNPLDVIGPLLPLSNSGPHVMSLDCHVAEIDTSDDVHHDTRVACAIASILNAAPAQADKLAMREREIDFLDSEVRRLSAERAALLEFVRHKKGCARLSAYGAECSCGFDRALAETEPK